MNIRLLEYEDLQRMVDYSFGDHSGVLGNVPNAYMKKANINNLEFIEALNSHSGDVMTLFIDNIRLYRRQIDYSDWLHKRPISPQDRIWLSQFDDEDLLNLCSQFPHKQFAIFTAFEDTPLDHYIEGKIPNNVRSINATNAVYLCDKIHPMPHGLERIMRPGYDHHDILRKYMNIDTPANNLMYVNHREDTGERGSLRDMFRGWATISERLTYEPYIAALKDHKFILCPSGNGIGSARNWETLYMRRVPVLEWHPYKEIVFSGFPVLFVESYSQVTRELLEKNEHLYQEAKNMDMDKLDLQKIFNKRILI
jgi:hypothetical protein